MSYKSVQIVVLTVRKGEEFLGLVPVTFCEAVVDWKMETPYWEVSIPTFMDILVFQLSKRAGTGFGLEGVLWWC